MAKLTADQFQSLKRRYRTQKGLRTTLGGLWDEIDYFTGPVKEAGSTASNPEGGTGANPEVRADLWDHTAIEGREKLTASIYSSAMGNAYRWFFFGARDPELQKDQEVASWLSDESEAVWNDIQDSDFNTEMPAALHELVGPGNCFISMEILEGELEDYKDDKGRAKTRMSWEGVDFTAIPLRSCYFEPDRKNMIKTFWERHDWKPSQAIDFFEDEGLPIPEDVLDTYKKGTEKNYEIVFCVFKRQMKGKTRYPSSPDMRPWGCVWWREDKGEMLGEEKGYYEPPVHKGIWARTPGSKWGHGPGNLALPTVKYVNGWKELMRASGEKVVDPAWVTTERNLLSDVDLKAAGVTVVRDVEKIKPLESGAKFDVAEGMLERDQKMIRDIFHVDDLQLKDSPAMTATEAQIRYEWMMRLLGKTLAFIQAYLLSPIVLNLLAMRIRVGAARPMPKKLKEAGGLLSIEFQGPLARSMRTDEVAAIERGATFIAGLAQFYPEIRAAMDPVVAVKHVFNRLGIPSDVIPPDNILRKKMQEIIDSIQQSQQAATAKDAMDAKKKNAEATAAAPLGGTAGPVQYPALPPQPRLTPGGRVVQ